MMTRFVWKKAKSIPEGWADFPACTRMWAAIPNDNVENDRMGAAIFQHRKEHYTTVFQLENDRPTIREFSSFDEAQNFVDGAINKNSVVLKNLKSAGQDFEIEFENPVLN